MSKIFLCGHTGSENRGCEAIVRSTVSILNDIGVSDIVLMSFAGDQDKKINLDKVIKIVEYKTKNNKVERYVAAFKRKIFGNYLYGQKKIHKPMIDLSDVGDVYFNIGGDTYCYSRPVVSYSLNKIAKEHNIPTIFWGCSLDDHLKIDNEMEKDLNLYNKILTRETLSYNIFKSNINNKNKINVCCDPAFHLKKKKTDLPPGFFINNTIGINISPLVVGKNDFIGSKIYKNLICLIDNMLENSNMNICFIPHVYNIEKNTQDILILNQIFERYKRNNRVCIINNELSCEELKYIISNCRFFIGARTHSIIAAYSSGVPAIALSYSLKSRGIAKDLFGSEDSYVVSWKDLKNDDDLLNIFKELYYDEDKIRQLYKNKLPKYKESIMIETKKMLEELNFEF